jgi:hypothetical protein
MTQNPLLTLKVLFAFPILTFGLPRAGNEVRRGQSSTTVDEMEVAYIPSSAGPWDAPLLDRRPRAKVERIAEVNTLI